MSTTAPPDLKTWGFAIYRTTYTPTSNSQWPSFISLLESRALQAASVEQPDTYTPEQLSLPVVSDAEILDGASVSTVRNHFRQFARELRAREGAEGWSSPRYEVCVLVDEESLVSVTEEAPKPPAADLDGKGWVYLINLGDENEEGGEEEDDEEDEEEEEVEDGKEESEEAFPEEDEGWMKVAVPVLLPRCFQLLKSPFAWEDMVYRAPPEVAYP